MEPNQAGELCENCRWLLDHLQRERRIELEKELEDLLPPALAWMKDVKADFHC